MQVRLNKRSRDVEVPELNISLSVLELSDGAIRLDIESPTNSPEVVSQLASRQGTSVRIAKRIRHEVRNELHTISVATYLLREQLRLGQQDDAEETFADIQHAVARLNQHTALSGNLETDRRGQSRRVLLVEDQANERELLAELLRFRGFDVCAVADGPSAIQQLDRAPAPSVTLVDYNLPSGNALGVLREIRERPESESMRVLVVSGDAEVPEAEADGWFRKPVDLDRLLDAMTVS